MALPAAVIFPTCCWGLTRSTQHRIGRYQPADAQSASVISCCQGIRKSALVGSLEELGMVTDHVSQEADVNAGNVVEVSLGGFDELHDLHEVRTRNGVSLDLHSESTTTELSLGFLQ
jgi:hypothetical protein